MILKLSRDPLANALSFVIPHSPQYYEMSYGLNVEMHKQTEIAKRLNTLINQLLPFLQADHQQQVLQAVERAKQVTMQELNLIIGVSGSRTDEEGSRGSSTTVEPFSARVEQGAGRIGNAVATLDGIRRDKYTKDC